MISVIGTENGSKTVDDVFRQMITTTASTDLRKNPYGESGCAPRAFARRYRSLTVRETTRVGTSTSATERTTYSISNKTYQFDGIHFACPSQWALTPNPDRDTLVKVGAGDIEMRIGSVSADTNLSLHQLQRISGAGTTVAASA